MYDPTHDLPDPISLLERKTKRCTTRGTASTTPVPARRSTAHKPTVRNEEDGRCVWDTSTSSLLVLPAALHATGPRLAPPTPPPCSSFSRRSPRARPSSTVRRRPAQRSTTCSGAPAPPPRPLPRFDANVPARLGHRRPHLHHASTRLDSRLRPPGSAKPRLAPKAADASGPQLPMRARARARIDPRSYAPKSHPTHCTQHAGSLAQSNHSKRPPDARKIRAGAYSATPEAPSTTPAFPPFSILPSAKRTARIRTRTRSRFDFDTAARHAARCTLARPPRHSTAAACPTWITAPCTSRPNPPSARIRRIGLRRRAPSLSNHLAPSPPPQPLTKHFTHPPHEEGALRCTARRRKSNADADERERAPTPTRSHFHLLRTPSLLHLLSRMARECADPARCLYPILGLALALDLLFLPPSVSVSGSLAQGSSTSLKSVQIKPSIAHHTDPNLTGAISNPLCKSTKQLPPLHRTTLSAHAQALSPRANEYRNPDNTFLVLLHLDLFPATPHPTPVPYRHALAAPSICANANSQT
ncbi:hypothetical protein B0H16DRAFT_1884894 [Mycena metata]|uniref:Uncharacterized protein n=1 Tax=Mycena metata TaxID=1033252 RepID=A0AAD7JAB1_9AGAR|nr:hypothetical protein B0H16DRAFT_1884894 [Mycena metata]